MSDVQDVQAGGRVRPELRHPGKKQALVYDGGEWLLHTILPLVHTQPRLRKDIFSLLHTNFLFFFMDIKICVLHTLIISII